MPKNKHTFNTPLDEPWLTGLRPTALLHDYGVLVHELHESLGDLIPMR